MREALIDAGWGGAVTLVLSVIPFSSVIGGAVAADRHGGGYVTGFWLGTLAGIVAMVPLLVLFLPTLYLVSVVLGYGIDPSAIGFDVFFALSIGFFLLYTVGLSAVGGLFGVWIGDNTEWNLDPERWV